MFFPINHTLVSWLVNLSFVSLQSRTPNSITIEVHGETQVYDLLCILDFNNVRKRMSVIVRRDNRITLLCKGADSTIYERLDRSCAPLQELTTAHLHVRTFINPLKHTFFNSQIVFQDFAQDGLRTLCLAKKVIDTEEYEEWIKKHHEAT
jgi:phospholipid-translocating ATPase